MHTRAIACIVHARSVMEFTTDRMGDVALNLTALSNKLIWAVQPQTRYPGYHGYMTRGHITVDFVTGKAEQPKPAGGGWGASPPEAAPPATAGAAGGQAVTPATVANSQVCIDVHACKRPFEYRQGSDGGLDGLAGPADAECRTVVAARPVRSLASGLMPATVPHLLRAVSCATGTSI